MKRLALPLILLGVACATAKNETDDDDGTGVGGAGGGVTAGGAGGAGNTASCQGVAFTDGPADWSLPSYPPASSGEKIFRSTAGYAYCPGSNGTRDFSTFDLDGDRLPDLTLQANCTDDTTTGAERWLVHKNTGSGFAASATDWTLPFYLPAASGEKIFRTTAGYAYCPGSNGTRDFSTFDIDGDAAPDLVMVANCTDDVETGASRWLVHTNTKSGFAPSASSWTLPSYLAASGDKVFDATAGYAYCPGDNGTRDFATFDIDGDAAPDLIMFVNCTNDVGTGATHWIVHKNTKSGFEANGINWTLPSYPPATSGEKIFRTSAGYAYCPGESGTRDFATFDIDGDQLPDLVMLANCTDDVATGATRWLVHKNTGSGFAAQATDWTLPSYQPAASGEKIFRSIAGYAYCPGENGTRDYTTFDIDGDRAPDLVMLANCIDDVTTGATRWLVHKNNGSGFDAQATDWLLPTYTPATSGEKIFRSLAGYAYCPDDNGTRDFVTLDLNGDVLPDMLMLNNCIDDAATGAQRWLLHPGRCAP
jgi:hypothetical protein